MQGPGSMLKQLSTYIDRSTSENLVHPDTQMFIEICNIINSRTDMPKIGITLIKKRLMSKNPKTLFLTLELLEVAANACELPFHTQVASRDFLQMISALVSREQEPLVMDKLFFLIKYWTIVFEPFRDILPLIFQLYDTLKRKGVAFPEKCDSKYAYLLRNKPKTSSSSSGNAGFGSYDDDKYGGSKYRDNSSNANAGQKKGPSSKEEKAKKDLQIVRDNLELTNQIIDACDPKEDVRTNDTLTDLISTLKEMENKLRKFIETLNEESLLSFCLELNDDLNKTFERYKYLKNFKRPPPFIPAIAENNYDEPETKPKNFYAGPSMNQQQQQQQQQNREKQPQARQQLQAPKNDDLLDFLDSKPSGGNQGNAPENKPKTNVDLMDLFSFDDSKKEEPKFQVQQQQQFPNNQMGGQMPNPMGGQMNNQMTNQFNNPKPIQPTNVNFLDMDSTSPQQQQQINNQANLNKPTSDLLSMYKTASTALPQGSAILPDNVPKDMGMNPNSSQFQQKGQGMQPQGNQQGGFNRMGMMQGYPNYSTAYPGGMMGQNYNPQGGYPQNYNQQGQYTNPQGQFGNQPSQFTTSQNPYGQQPGYGNQNPYGQQPGYSNFMTAQANPAYGKAPQNPYQTNNPGYGMGAQPGYGTNQQAGGYGTAQQNTAYRAGPPNGGFGTNQQPASNPFGQSTDVYSTGFTQPQQKASDPFDISDLTSNTDKKNNQSQFQAQGNPSQSGGTNAFDLLDLQFRRACK